MSIKKMNHVNLSNLSNLSTHGSSSTDLSKIQHADPVKPTNVYDAGTISVYGDAEWHMQQEILLKEWAEVASCFRWLHDRSHQKFKRQNMWFVLPVIVLSTLTGTLSFAQSSFPVPLQIYVPIGVGTLNIIAGMLGTIAQFLRVGQLLEGHCAASIAFGKLSRAIRVELALPRKERNTGGRDFLKICRTELDRLMEQSPAIPIAILSVFEKIFKQDIINEIFVTPEILNIHAVSIYDADKHLQLNLVTETVEQKRKKSDATLPPIILKKEVTSNLNAEQKSDS